MLDKNLTLIKDKNENNLQLSEGLPLREFIRISILSITVVLLYFSSLSILDYRYGNNLYNIIYLSSNLLDDIYLLIVLFIIAVLIIYLLILLPKLFIREKIRITDSEVKFYYYFIIIPIYRTSIRKYELKLIVEKRHGKTISPQNGKVDEILLIQRSKKYCIRTFQTFQATEKFSFLKLLKTHGIILDQSIDKLLSFEIDDEDLSLDFNINLPF